MDHVQAIDAGDSNLLHGLLLDLADHGGGVFAGMRCVVHHVQDGAHLVVADNQVQFGGIDRLVGVVLKGGDIQLYQLPSLLFQGHLSQHTFHLGLDGFVGGNGRCGLGRVTGTNSR